MPEVNNDKIDTPTIPALKQSFKVRLVMKSDWHVGTGAGRPGNIDRLLARDEDGFPFVPAKTLNGIWRDAMERLVTGLDEDKDNGWKHWVDYIFGNQPALTRKSDIEVLSNTNRLDRLRPRPSAITITPARLPESLRQLIATKDRNQLLESALTFIKPGVAIDDRSGMAKPDFLRFEEMGRIETTLISECHLDMHPCSQPVAIALLLASAKLVERIGGKRRRGAGLCELKILDDEGKPVDPTKAVGWLEKQVVAPTYAEGIDDIHSDLITLDSKVNQPEWNRIELAVHLEQPVSIAARTLGNVTETLDFVPGTYFLPYLTNAFKKIGFDPRDAISKGDIQVLPATLEVIDSRGLPVPAVMACHKLEGGFHKPGTVYNRLMEMANTKASGETPQLKGFRQGYIGPFCFTPGGKSRLPVYDSVPLSVLTHNTVEDEKQRPTEEVGGVYSREAIKAGTKLRTEIKIHKSISDALPGEWQDSLNGSIRLGVSRKDEYGLARIQVLSKTDTPFSTTFIGGDKLTVWLLSDVMLRDNGLRVSSSRDLLKSELEDKLKVTLKNYDPKDPLVGSIILTRRIESWHEAWGFPRPSFICLAAGSCAVFEIDGTLDSKILGDLEAFGIGERRGEGYGQICFNSPLLTQAVNSWQPADIKKILPNPPANDETIEQWLKKLADSDMDLARRIEMSAWRHAIDNAVIGATVDKTNRQKLFGLDQNDKEPSMSQLGAFRSSLSRLRNDNNKSVMDWLEHLKKTPNRSDKWPNGALGTIPKMVDIKDKSYIFCKLTEIIGWQNPPVIISKPDDLRNSLWAYTVRSLFDAWIRAHRKNL